MPRILRIGFPYTVMILAFLIGRIVPFHPCLGLGTFDGAALVVMIAVVAVAVMVVRTYVRSLMRVLALAEVLVGMLAVVAPAMPAVTVRKNGG